MQEPPTAPRADGHGGNTPPNCVDALLHRPQPGRLAADILQHTLPLWVGQEDARGGQADRTASHLGVH